MRYSKGWFKLHRKLFSMDKNESLLHDEALARYIYIYLISIASYEVKTVKFNKEPIVLNVGDAITSYSELQKLTCSSTQKVRTAFRLLQKLTLTQLRANRGGLLVSVCNYSRFQSLEHDPNIKNGVFPKNQHSLNMQLTGNQHSLNTIGKKKEIRNKKEERRIKKETTTTPISSDFRNLRNSDFSEKRKIEAVENDSKLKNITPELQNVPKNLSNDNLSISAHQENKSEDLAINRDSENYEKTDENIQDRTRPITKKIASVEADYKKNQIKKIVKKKKKYNFTNEDLSIAKDWAEWSNLPFCNLELWADKIRLAISKTKYYTDSKGSYTNMTHQQFRELFERIKISEFWSKTTQSPTGLLKKGQNGNTKIQNALTQLVYKKGANQLTKKEKQEIILQKSREQNKGDLF